ncbi:MAG: peptide-methionine (S)-S-oxide reductase MsrA [Candidatus Poseidoniaceae archaeon]|jgi:peptide-methionine (S)-S-oxide reductase|nr:peptide-methionine (S)-S-oxide reductase MsrA [Candidatus Poseidoniaceae archaeon]
MARAVLGAGCFWCIEGAYKNMRGIDSALPSYTGGSDPNPTYKAVCGGNTGHAETVELVFDESVISYEKIIEVFFAIHDPTQMNRQGNDIGTQYRSAIFYESDNQKLIAESVRDRFSNYFDKEIVTEITYLNNHHIAEEYHHDYFNNNPGNQYCQFVVAPKLSSIRQKFSELY